jgi:outer membrane murein-binding lipoprotein Lpp
MSLDASVWDVRAAGMSAVRAKSSKGKGPPVAKAVLTAAAWSEADIALAEVIQADFRVAGALAKVSRSASRAKITTLAEKTSQLEMEVFALRQALTRAAKQRGFSAFGAVGDEVRYDSRRHRPLRGEVKSGHIVRIVSPGVIAGDRVLAKAEVRRVRSPPT